MSLTPALSRPPTPRRQGGAPGRERCPSGPRPPPKDRWGKPPQSPLFWRPELSVVPHPSAPGCCTSQSRIRGAGFPGRGALTVPRTPRLPEAGGLGTRAPMGGLQRQERRSGVSSVAKQLVSTPGSERGGASPGARLGQGALRRRRALRSRAALPPGRQVSRGRASPGPAHGACSARRAPPPARAPPPPAPRPQAERRAPEPRRRVFRAAARGRQEGRGPAPSSGFNPGLVASRRRSPGRRAADGARAAQVLR